MGNGKEIIVGCPQKQIPRWFYRFIELADFAEHGNLPVAGGVMDQTRAFLEALRLWRYEKAKFQNSRPVAED